MQGCKHSSIECGFEDNLTVLSSNKSKTSPINNYYRCCAFFYHILSPGMRSQFRKCAANTGKSEYTLEAKREAMGRTAVGSAEAVVNKCNLPISVDQFVEEIESMYESVFNEYIEFLPGAEKLVKHLKDNKIPIAIATSSKNSTFKLKSKHHGKFFELFHHIVRGSDDPDVKNGKPAPDIFLIAASRFDADSLPQSMKNVLVFEDSANGVRAGIAAGMQVVWVPAECTDTSTATATLIVPSLEQFDPTLFNLPPYQ
ncbi:Pseudouridine-5'-phosphatase [Orchesella cincta]|uniref:Pseudouridine-5'-phosphatase n=1 Tax=Orchesella cincta TaxID=48709 RepID=A0A1D2NL04_ORCCI|nr:Pseudouridine-5'-phosphatase [Orchesella cincta]